MSLAPSTLPLTLAGIQAVERRDDDARQLYAQAWDAAADELSAASPPITWGVEADPAAALHWRLAALDHARQADAELVADCLPSLYVNLGRAYELTGAVAGGALYPAGGRARARAPRRTDARLDRPPAGRWHNGIAATAPRTHQRSRCHHRESRCLHPLPAFTASSAPG